MENKLLEGTAQVVPGKPSRNGTFGSGESVKPTITVFDGRGIHNSALETTEIRLGQESAWKDHKTVCIIPAASKVSTKVALSWMSLVRPPNQPFYTFLAEGLEVGAAYSHAIEAILAQPELSTWKFILTIEHDNMPPPDGLLMLFDRMEQHPELSCISGLYYTKGMGGCAQIWGDIKDPVLNYRPQPPKAGELIECYGTGMGFALWRMEMFTDNELPRPLFQTLASAQGGGTQDLMFWTNARKRGYRCAVDCRVCVGHVAEDGTVY